MPRIALAIIDGLVAKGKCYSALVQMLGTRSIAERLELLLQAMADAYGHPTPEGVVIERTVTHEQFAMMVGATRQWVSVSLERMQREGRLRISRSQIVLTTPAGSGPEEERTMAFEAGREGS
jgi:CRP-like cAMP-binding protein